MREEIQWYLFGFLVLVITLSIGLCAIQERHRAENEGCQRLCGTHRLIKVSTGLCFCE